MDSKRIKLSPPDNEPGTKVLSGDVSTKTKVSTDDVASEHVLPVDRKSGLKKDLIEDEAMGSGRSNDIDAKVEPTIDWQAKIDEALSVYRNVTVSAILDDCFQREFENLRASTTSTRSELQDAGRIFHDYIAKFYGKFNYRKKATIDDGDAYVCKMLRAFSCNPKQPIMWDRLVDHSDPTSAAIHTHLSKELIQFYNFVNENKLISVDIEASISDPIHRVNGRINALFQVNNSDKLVLYDWTRSALMLRGSPSLQRKTLQLNIYKYILEKFHDKIIGKMCSVIFHKDKENYEIIEIEDINFHCACSKCIIQN